MFLAKLFKHSDYSSSCRDLVIPQCCIIRLWFGTSLVRRKPDSDRTCLDNYTHFEAQILGIGGKRLPENFPTLPPKYKYDNTDQRYYSLVPREILERFIIDLMRKHNMCPGPWMTEEEKGK